MSKPFEHTLKPEQTAVVESSAEALNGLFLNDPARYLSHPLPRPVWVDYDEGFFDLDRDDVAAWLVEHPANADHVAKLWDSNRNVFDEGNERADFVDELVYALTEANPYVQDFLHEQLMMVKLNEGVRSYQRHLSENGAAPYATARRGAADEGDHDHVLENWPEAEFVIGRSFGLDVEQVLDVVGHWLENGGAAVRR